MGFVSYLGMLAGQSECRNKCLWLMNPFDHGYKVENIPLFALPLITNSSNHLEAWPRGIRIAKSKVRGWHKIRYYHGSQQYYSVLSCGIYITMNVKSVTLAST